VVLLNALKNCVRRSAEPSNQKIDGILADSAGLIFVP